MQIGFIKDKRIVEIKSGSNLVFMEAGKTYNILAVYCEAGDIVLAVGDIREYNLKPVNQVSLSNLIQWIKRKFVKVQLWL